MPLIKSAIKRVRVSKRKTVKNRIVKTTTKDTMKNFVTLLADGKVAEAKVLFPTVQKVCDTMTKKNLWHKNKVARKIARLAKLLKTAGTNPVAETKKTAPKKVVPKKVVPKKVAPKKKA